MTEDQATAYTSWFYSAVYFCPMLGALVSDGLLGKYRTIFWVSMIYCLGHLVLSVGGTAAGNVVGLTPRVALALGLGLIAIGAGGIKPCVSANVGDQFGPRNQHLLERVYSWFYFSINFGSSFSTMLIPWLLHNPSFGPHVAFGVPGILMGVATWVFWLGRHKFVHAPAGGLGFVREVLTLDGLRALRTPVIVTLFVAFFWCLFDQSSTKWILQADSMDRHVFGTEWHSEQFHTLNGILILLFIPLFSYLIYPAVNRVFRLTPIRKISIGLFLTALAFVVPAWIQILIDRGGTPTVYWQGLAYIVLTAAEVMVSITGLEFSYTVAPKSMKSVVMAIWLLSNSLGNAVTAIVNTFIQNADGTSKLPGASYYWFFVGLMLAAAFGFAIVSLTFPATHSPKEDAADA
jgi:POT family proton-dependent oligopeptide transporter